MEGRFRFFKNKVLGPFDYFLIIGIIAANFVHSFVVGEVDLIGSLAAIAGVVCVVLVAKGNIWNYFFGVINVSLYAWISFKSDLYGDAALNALYYFPMQFIGLWQWRKRGATDNVKAVRARRMTLKQRALLISGCAILVALAGYGLDRLGDPQPYKDAATTVLSIVAQLLMVMAFSEQWLLWIVNNVISIAMWVICTVEGDSHASLMVLMWIFYLINSINGYRVWVRKLSGQERDHSKDTLNSSPA